MVKKTTVLLLGAAFLLTFVIAGCSKPGVSKKGYDKIQNGMSLTDVEKILGAGKKGESAAGKLGNLTAKGSAYIWEAGDKKITVVFKDDKVVSKSQVGF